MLADPGCRSIRHRGIDRETIRKYLAPATAEGLAPVPDEAFDKQVWRERIRRWPSPLFNCPPCGQLPGGSSEPVPESADRYQIKKPVSALCCLTITTTTMQLESLRIYFVTIDHR